MVLKTFNVDEVTYNKFSNFCKTNGISMSKQVQIFMAAQLEDEPEAKKEYIERLDKIRKGKFVRIDNFAKRYDL